MTDKDMITALAGMEVGQVVLLETSAEKGQAVSLSAIKALTDKDWTGIILSLNRPYRNLKAVFLQHEIDERRIFIIDCISKGQGEMHEEHDVKYVDDLNDLLGMSIAAEEATDETYGKKFLFIDSIPALLVHSEPQSVVKFLHSVMTKMRMRDVACVAVTFEGMEPETRATLAQFCDSVIKA